MSIRWTCGVVAFVGIALSSPPSGSAWAQTPGTTVQVNGAMRILVCRGKAGILRIEKDPSPRDISKNYVAMVLEYTRPTAAVGGDYENLKPGECSWNPAGHTSVPPEPGRVYFDVIREAQPWSATDTRQMDTTIKAGAYFPDAISLPRYLGDPNHYWGFFVDDVTHFSGSFGPRKETAQPRYFTVTGPLGGTGDVRKELRCRGGASGLMFTRGASAGTNLVQMTLAYRVSANVPGATGRGLEPGSCAWVERAGIAREPARVDFVTAGNAQLKQIQSGGTVDRTPTAAERYPDANTIPIYLTDPSRFWTFTVTVGAPTTAKGHAAWLLDMNAISAGPRSTQPTSVSGPIAGTGKFEPGKMGTASVLTIFDIRKVQASATLDGAVVRFEAATGSRPTVLVSTTPPTGQPGSYRFAGSPLQLAVGGSALSAGMERYAAASNTPLARNTRYWFIITANQTDQARANQATGEFKTWGQRVSIRFTEINVLSDGDRDSDGELTFIWDYCPSQMEMTGYLRKDWGDGKHSIDLEATSRTDTTPDRFRVIIAAYEDDYEAAAMMGSRLNYPKVSCSRSPDLAPGRNSSYEWNSIARDIDLTRYPGQKGGEQFVWRSKPMRDGSTVMFEVRGHLVVTRQ